MRELRQYLHRSKRLKAVFGLAAVIGIGIAAFILASYSTSGGGTARAQVSPSGTPEVHEQPPNPTIQARMDAVTADAAKGNFVGKLNGFTFVADGSDIPDRADCTREELRELPRADVASAVTSSKLNFGASSIPAGYQLSNETATVCGSNVIGAGRAYASNKAVYPISITREDGDAWYTAFATKDRMEATTINGHPAVVVKPVYDGALAFVLMHDDQGTTWTVSAGMSVDDLVKVAEGLK